MRLNEYVSEKKKLKDLKGTLNADLKALAIKFWEPLYEKLYDKYRLNVLLFDLDRVKSMGRTDDGFEFDLALSGDSFDYEWTDMTVRMYKKFSCATNINIEEEEDV